MPEKRGSNVDSDTLLAIQDGNKEVIKEFEKSLSKTTNDIKEYLLLHISPLKDDVNRMRTDVADLYEKDRNMRDRIGVLEQRQSVDEGNREGRDTVEEKVNRKTEIGWGKIAVIVAIISLICGTVGAAIGYFLC